MPFKENGQKYGMNNNLQQQLLLIEASHVTGTGVDVLPDTAHLTIMMIPQSHFHYIHFA